MLQVNSCLTQEKGRKTRFSRLPRQRRVRTQLSESINTPLLLVKRFVDRFGWVLEYPEAEPSHRLATNESPPSCHHERSLTTGISSLTKSRAFAILAVGPPTCFPVAMFKGILIHQGSVITWIYTPWLNSPLTYPNCIYQATSVSTRGWMSARFFKMCTCITLPAVFCPSHHQR